MRHTVPVIAEPSPPAVIIDMDGRMLAYTTQHFPKTDPRGLPGSWPVLQDTNGDGKPDQKATVAIRHEDLNGNGERDDGEPIHFAIGMVQSVNGGLIEMNDGMRLAAAQAVAERI